MLCISDRTSSCIGVLGGCFVLLEDHRGARHKATNNVFVVVSLSVSIYLTPSLWRELCEQITSQAVVVCALNGISGLCIQQFHHFLSGCARFVHCAVERMCIHKELANKVNKLGFNGRYSGQ